jgi:hypothetical protein
MDRKIGAAAERLNAARFSFNLGGAVMRSTRWFGAVLFAPAVVIGFTLVGCGDGDKKPSGSGTKPPVADSGKGGGDTSKGGAAGDKSPVEGTGEGILKGKVVYDGTPPERKSLSDLMGALQDPKDKEVCLSGDTKDPLWIVGGDKGVANVVVWLRAPAGKFLKTPDKEQASTAKKTMDQPHCAFEPHVVAFNPSFYDATSKKQKKTGMVLEVDNSAPIKHNTAWSGNSLFNSGKNEIIPSKGKMVVEAVPSKESAAGGEDLLNISCDIHKWMRAKAAVFDHPFYAVTNDKGEFEIKGVPAGTDLTLCFWHESMDDKSLKGAKTEPINLKAGENTKELKIK